MKFFKLKLSIFVDTNKFNDMAKVKFSALVSEMRNKLNGSVFSKNRGGNYLRNKVTPINQSTAAQVLVRSRLAGISSSFRSLLSSQIQAWNAATGNFPYTDIFGDSKELSGSQLYMKLNMNLANAGAAQIPDPPAPEGVAPLLTLTANAASGGVKGITFTVSPTPADTVLIVEATPSYSPGKTFVKNLYRKVAALPAATASPFIATTGYNAVFGDVTTGQKVSFRAFLVNTNTGEVSLAISTSTIAT